MNIEIMACTLDPITVISRAAGTCYGKANVNGKRVRHCFEAGHMSVFEHASVTFRVEGISRACSHQLVRHRLASYSQESQRYCKVDSLSDDWFVIPPEIAKRPERANSFKTAMRVFAYNYADELEHGTKPEDARFLLPEACKTTIVVSMNCRELFHFMDVRATKQAQWEIRELANAMADSLSRVSGWCELVAMWSERRDSQVTDSAQAPRE